MDLEKRESDRARALQLTGLPLNLAELAKAPVSLVFGSTNEEICQAFPGQNLENLGEMSVRIRDYELRFGETLDFDEGGKSVHLDDCVVLRAELDVSASELFRVLGSRCGLRRAYLKLLYSPKKNLLSFLLILTVKPKGALSRLFHLPVADLIWSDGSRSDKKFFSPG